MSLTVNTHQPSSYPQTKTMSIPARDWTASHAKAVDDPNQAVLTDIGVPTDAPATVSEKRYIVNDIYKNSSIAGANKAANKRGYKLHFQNTETWSVTDVAQSTEAVDATYRVDLPCTCALTITVPDNSLVTETLIEDLVARTVGDLFSKGANAAESRITSLLKGAMIPKGL